jgi:hypothetical protein
VQDSQTTGGDTGASQRWWAPGPDPELTPISARRAYGEVLFVFLGFFATGIVAAAVLLAGRYKDLEPKGSWALYGTNMVDVVSQIGLAVAMVLLLSDRRGVTFRTLGLSLPRRGDGGVAFGRLTRIASWAVFALVLGGVVNALLQSGHLPTSQTTGPAALFGVFDSVQAGVIEEMVVLGFVVVTLRQARRPWWEVTLVALVLRGSYHIYYGPGVFGILIWAALYYWIYLRFRTLIPLIVCHAAWDAVGFLSQEWSIVAVFGLLAAVSLWIAGPITWLVERGDRTPAPAWTGSVPIVAVPPGWHPDPSGVNQWRWWDGYRWTEHVSGPAAYPGPL